MSISYFSITAKIDTVSSKATSVSFVLFFVRSATLYIDWIHFSTEHDSSVSYGFCFLQVTGYIEGFVCPQKWLNSQWNDSKISDRYDHVSEQ